MAIYYVRITGSDSNAGTSPATAWRTISKALGSAGISSGDTVYIGAGTYRESITVNMTSATAETIVFGDINGLYTGDAGEVVWTVYTKNDETHPGSQVILSLNGRDFLTFINIKFISTNTSVNTGSGGVTDIKFLNCIFLLLSSGSTFIMIITIPFGVVSNWIIDRCKFFTNAGSSCINITLTTGSGSDYNTNFVVKNSLFVSVGNNAFNITSSGTSSEEGGGVYITNCTFLCGNGCITTATTRVGGSTFAYPVVVNNCLMWIRTSTTALNSSELGNLIENYNVIYTSTPRTNVLAGPQTVSDYSIPLLIDFDKFLFLLSKNSPLNCHGNRTISDLEDISNNLYINGQVNHYFNGIATSATESSLTDSSKNFGTSDNLNGYTVKILDGQGKGQTKTINGNTNTVISGDGLWITQPNSTSKYVIYSGPISSTALVSSGTNATMTDNQAKWGENFWQGYELRITSGTASGENFIVSGNSPTVLSGWSTFTTIPVSGDAYQLSWGSGTSNSGINYIHVPVGCYSVYNTAIKETGVVLSGSKSIKLFGPGFQDFNFPVNSGQSTNVKVWGYFDDYYSGTKPQLIIKDAPYIQVNAVTGIMTGPSGAWEQISVSFVPSGDGVVTARLRSNATGVGGSAYFDEFFIN